tara:strand:+ start:505 stop:927 length:423 start_codon:yes stop_codon:yes gene_type:complete
MIVLEKYQKVWTMTPYSNFELLCKVLQHDTAANMVLVQLPCTLQGKKQALVPFTDIRIMKPKEPQQEACNKPKNKNPFKGWLNALEARIEAREAREEQEKQQSMKASQQVKEEPELDAETLQLLEGLTPEQRKQYMEILK